MPFVTRPIAVATILAVVLASTAPSPAADPAPTGSLEGVVLGVDGRPLEGYEVVLVDDAGATSATATTGPDGSYRFGEVVPGRYGLGLQGPDGFAAPVLGAPVEIRAGRSLRRDIKLVTREGEPDATPVVMHKGLGLWWAGLSTGAKAGVVVGIAAVAALAVGALGDDDDDEQPASPR